jgi:hypothetical protein
VTRDNAQIENEKMTHVLQGVIHGKTLLLTDDPGFCDGESVEVVIRPLPVATPTAGKTAAGMLATLQDADDDVNELYRFRHSEPWREVEP